jgi:hypothetical protein
MYSNFIKFIFAATAFSPILISYWTVDTFMNRKQLDFFIKLNSVDDFFKGSINVLANHYLLLFFALVVLLCRFLINKAKNELSVGSISLKQIKTSDVNFDRVIFSYMLPFARIPFGGNVDLVLIGVIFLYLLFVMVSMSSYHHNLAVRILLGYKHYEVQTTNDITYLMLSKQKLINKDQVKEYVHVSDYMIINVT